MKTRCVIRKHTGIFPALIATVALVAAPGAFAQGTAFTYQGQLDEAGFLTSGSYDMEFKVWDTAAGGSQVGATVTHYGIPVDGGMFSVPLDFGSGIFSGADRWLEIGVQTNGGGGFTTLSPRTKVTSAPYAIYAATAVGLAGGINDADADPANELNTSVDLTGTTLSVIDAGGSKNVDLAPLLDDNDWAYLSGTGLTGSIYHSGAVIVENDYLEVKGNGNEQAYIGGDGSGNDVQIGSLNPSVKTVAAWNPATGTRMSLIASNVTALAKFIGDGSQLTGIGAAAIAPDSVGSSEIINDSILAIDIAANAVGSSEVIDNSLLSDDLAPNSVGASEIATGAVGSSEVLDNSLTALDLAANSVGASEIAAGAVGTSEVADGSLLGADLANNTVGSAQLADVVHLGSSSIDGNLYVYKNSAGGFSINLDGGSTYGGRLWLYSDDGQNGVWMAGGSGGAGVIQLYNDNASERVTIDGYDAAGGGSATFDASDGSLAVQIQGEGAGSGGEITLNDSSAVEKVNLTTSGGGNVYLRDGGGITVEENDGTSGVSIQGGTGGYGQFFQHDGNYGVYVDGDAGTDAGGVLRVYDAAGSASITLDGDVGGDGRIYCDELQINGGSDLSEQFDIQTAAQPGSVVCIDAANPGKLVVSSRAYDRTVAGIVSGAGGVKPGMMMGQEGTIANGDQPVALSGRVYCRVDAGQGPIQPGDLITTSDVPGHGMKVSDHSRAHGAIIGKAMTGLDEGQGLVLVLVSLH